MTKSPFLALCAAGILAAGVSACGDDSDDTSTSSSGGGGTTTEQSSSTKVEATLNGAGSTFAAPIYQQLGSDLKGQGLTINYQGVGSGDGVSQFTGGTVDFAGSDPALTDEEIAKVPGKDPAEFPIAFGAITVSYNLPGVETGLQLDGETVADMYLGKIKKWNDPKIAAQNSGKDLPDTDITIVHRSDSSGTTKGFTDFLSRYSSAWKDGPGVDKDIKWPTGTGAKGNDGVAGAVKQTEGAVGYVEQAYALQNNFTFANVKNKAGKYIEPTLESTSASGTGVDVPADLRVNVIDSADPAAYPISSQTFLIVHKDLCKGGLDKTKAQGMKNMIDFILGDGQQTISKLSYAPLPDNIKTKATALAGELTCNGAALSGQ